MTTNPLAENLLTSEGSFDHLGATVSDSGVNFALFSKHATEVFVLLYERMDAQQPYVVLPMNRTGDHWHLFVHDLEDTVFYLFACDGPFVPEEGHRFNRQRGLIDPVATMISGATNWQGIIKLDEIGDHEVVPKCVAVVGEEFDWQGDTPPNTPLAETVVYEVHLRGFTAHESSAVTEKGTYRGFIEKIPYLKELGVTAVELLPIMEAYRYLDLINPYTGKKNVNDWGYDSLSWVAPAEHLASTRLKQVEEFKLLVRELHKAGIEVILDIVFNHTRETDEAGPTFSFRGLDNKVYYMLVPDDLAKYANFTGCGNTVNCNHPEVRRFILDVLRYWVNEFHVDGFRFDLCAVFGIDVDQSVSADTPILREIIDDPVLSKVKLIAEPWSWGAWLQGQFPEPFAEWSDRFRETVRRFVRGEAGFADTLAKVVTGSRDMFGENGKRLPVNYVTAHDGFCLMDLVSYDHRRNMANGRNGECGDPHNFSWNCGFEGDVDFEESDLTVDQKKAIKHLRKQQIKNFIAILMVSRGVPMILYGDEMGKTKRGNNDSWNQPDLNDLDWSLLEANSDLYRFFKMMIAFRKKHNLGGRGQDPEFRPTVLHGVEPEKPDFSEGARFLAWELRPFSNENGSSVYVATNGYWESIDLSLPEGSWVKVIDTASDTGGDIVLEEDGVIEEGKATISPRSTLILVRKD